MIAVGGRMRTAVLLALLALFAFGLLTLQVLRGATIALDEGVLLWMDAHASPALDAVFLRVSALGDAVVVAALAVVAATLLWLLQRKWDALLLGIAVGGALLIVPLLKLGFGRARPELFEWRAHSADASSYPSGHALFAVVLLVALTSIIFRLSQRRPLRVLTAAVAAIAILSVGLSRLYLGVHYPSDVLAGYLLGWTWLVCAALLAGALRQREQRRPFRS